MKEGKRWKVFKFRLEKCSNAMGWHINIYSWEFTLIIWTDFFFHPLFGFPMFDFYSRVLPSCIPNYHFGLRFGIWGIYLSKDMTCPYKPREKESKS